MRELIRTNDAVVLELARSLLEEAGIMAVVMDAHMSVLEGSIGMFPRRLMVVADEHAEARSIIEAAELGEWLYRP